MSERIDERVFHLFLLNWSYMKNRRILTNSRKAIKMMKKREIKKRIRKANKENEKIKKV